MSLYKNKGYWAKYKSNQTIYNVGMDNINHLYKNLDKYPNNFSLKYHQQNPIEYRINNEGFRTNDDFNSEDVGNVFLGCSHTFGVGLHLENTWGYKLNDLIGGKFWNLSIPGTGVMTHYRILKGYYKELKIKNIFHFAPRMYPRYEFIVNNKPMEFIIGSTNEEMDNLFGNLINESLLNDDQLELTYNSHIDAIKWLSHEIGANYYSCDMDEVFKIKNDISLEARDMSHFSVCTHDLIFKYFLKMYNFYLFEKNKNKQPLLNDIENYMKTKTKTLI
jgi:hypothetical protein